LLLSWPKLIWKGNHIATESNPLQARVDIEDMRYNPRYSQLARNWMLAFFDQGDPTLGAGPAEQRETLPYGPTRAP
jgi:hypothetical protein